MWWSCDLLTCSEDGCGKKALVIAYHGPLLAIPFCPQQRACITHTCAHTRLAYLNVVMLRLEVNLGTEDAPVINVGVYIAVQFPYNNSLIKLVPREGNVPYLLLPLHSTAPCGVVEQALPRLQ